MKVSSKGKITFKTGDYKKVYKGKVKNGKVIDLYFFDDGEYAMSCAR